MMPHRSGSADSLRAALHGVRALILDADGVIVRRGELLPGASSALRRLAAAGIPYRIVTNFSTTHRDTLAARFSGDGLTVDAGHVVTAASAAARHTARAHPGGPLFVIAPPDSLREFEGQRLLTSAEARARDARAAAVVIGDAGDEFPFGDLDAAFRLVRNGAELLAMHRNPWWLTARGVTLDAGALVAGLEFALGRRARVLGKPSPYVFREAAAALAADLRAGRLPRSAVVMVGDDLRSDLAPARRLGMRTALVLSGKTPAEEVEAAVRGARFAPTVVAPSLAEVVEAVA